MKKIVLTFLLYFLLFVSVFAQNEQPSDEFIPANCEVAMARLDSYAVALQNEPDAMAYIIFYDGKITRDTKKFLPSVGEARMITNDLRSYLIKNRKIEKNRIVIINGGTFGDFFVELWVVSSGQNPPKPNRFQLSLKRIKYRKRGLPRLCSEIGF